MNLLMDKIIKKYKLTDPQQNQEDKQYWQQQSIERKIEVLESLREDAIKLGFYPEQPENGSKYGLRRVFRIIKQT